MTTASKEVKSVAKKRSGKTGRKTASRKTVKPAEPEKSKK